MYGFAAFAAGAVLLAAATSPAWSGEKAALVLESNGSTAPEVSLFQEVEAGTRLKLSAKTRLTMSHYRRCEEVSFTGGSVLVEADDLEITGARDVDRVAAPCAEAVQLVAADITNAAVVTRSTTRPTIIGKAPEIVLSGPTGKRFDTLKIISGKRLVATVPLDAPRVMFSRHDIALNDKERYAFFFTGPEVRQYAVSVVVKDGITGLLVLAP